MSIDCYCIVLMSYTVELSDVGVSLFQEFGPKCTKHKEFAVIALVSFLP